MNELRFKQCFQLRATRFSLPIKEFDPLFLTVKNIKSDDKKLQIEEFYWIRNDLLIKKWIEEIVTYEAPKSLEYWMLETYCLLFSL